LRRLRPPLCARCGAPTAWPVERCRECSARRLAFASARSAVEYAGPAQALVRAWKERGLRHLAACAAELVVEHVERPAVDLITYVPSDPIRQLGRGGHPAEALARELAGHWQLELTSVLERGRTAERQATLPYARRGANVRGVFTARRPLVGRVLLVDDVYTTGSTVSAAASALRRRGVRSVEVVTLARAIRH
jgi:predicted amidophosphoribosyltransferase